jgi:hypothetical protein
MQTASFLAVTYANNENVIARYEAILLVAGRFLRKKKILQRTLESADRFPEVQTASFLAVTCTNNENVIARYEAIWFQADYAT